MATHRTRPPLRADRLNLRLPSPVPLPSLHPSLRDTIALHGGWGPFQRGIEGVREARETRSEGDISVKIFLYLNKWLGPTTPLITTFASLFVQRCVGAFLPGRFGPKGPSGRQNTPVKHYSRHYYIASQPLLSGANTGKIRRTWKIK